MFTDAAIIFAFGNSAAFGTPVVPEVNIQKAVSFAVTLLVIVKLLDLDVDKFKSDIVQRLGSRGYELYFKDLNMFMNCYKYREEVN